MKASPDDSTSDSALMLVGAFPTTHPGFWANTYEELLRRPAADDRHVLLDLVHQVLGWPLGEHRP